MNAPQPVELPGDAGEREAGAALQAPDDDLQRKLEERGVERVEERLEPAPVSARDVEAVALHQAADPRRERLGRAVMSEDDAAVNQRPQTLLPELEP